MFSQIAQLVRRSRSTLIEDATGAIALMVLLIGALHLPGLV